MPYMINKDGTAICSMYGSQMEEAKKAGWKVYEPIKPAQPVEKEPDEPIIEAPAPKRGRPAKAK